MREASDILVRHANSTRYEQVRTPARQQIRELPASALPEHAQRWADAFAPRLRVLTDELAQLERNRDSIVDRLRGLVESALATLRSAQRLSRLPEGLGEWSGQEFLRIRFEEPDQATLTERLGEVIDEATRAAVKKNSDLRRDGMSLLLRGVGAALQPKGVAVEILKPDAVLRAERVPVGQMGDVFSGGQLLTAAIALYCTMAALRSNDRGRDKHRHAGTLFLDNPIGRANATYLLELQRAVSDALGVQLLYTTGLFDTTALAEFPLVIRLRNDADLRAGLKYISVEEHLRPGLPQQAPAGGTRRCTARSRRRGCSNGPRRTPVDRQARHRGSDGRAGAGTRPVRPRADSEILGRFRGATSCPAPLCRRIRSCAARGDPCLPPRPAPLAPQGTRRAARRRHHAVALVPHLSGHPYVQHAPGGHHRADHTADHHREGQPGPGHRAQERDHGLNQRHGDDQHRPYGRRAHRIGHPASTRGLLDPQRPVGHTRRRAPRSAGAGLSAARTRPAAVRGPFAVGPRSGASGSRSAVPPVAAPSSGASRRSAVPITVSLPTASRPLASGLKTLLPSGCPACADLRSPGAAYGSCGRFRPPFPMSRTRDLPRRFPRCEKFWPTPVRGRSDQADLQGSDSRRQSPTMAGQHTMSRPRYGSSSSGRLFELSACR